jgi:ankyrin repeat protein
MRGSQASVEIENNKKSLEELFVARTSNGSVSLKSSNRVTHLKETIEEYVSLHFRELDPDSKNQLVSKLELIDSVQELSNLIIHVNQNNIVEPREVTNHAAQLMQVIDDTISSKDYLLLLLNKIFLSSETPSLGTVLQKYFSACDDPVAIKYNVLALMKLVAYKELCLFTNIPCNIQLSFLEFLKGKPNLTGAPMNYSYPDRASTRCAIDDELRGIAINFYTDCSNKQNLLPGLLSFAFGSISSEEYKKGFRDIEVVKLLLNIDGIDVNYNACFNSDSILSFLIANARNEEAMMFLDSLEEYEKIKLLNLGLSEDFGNSPLHLAVGKGYREISEDNQVLFVSNLELAKRLIQLGADVNLKLKNSYIERHESDNSDYDNPNYNKQFITYYYELDPDYDSHVDGITALHLACARRDMEFCKLLIQSGANIKFKNAAGETPLDVIDCDREIAKKRVPIGIITRDDLYNENIDADTMRQALQALAEINENASRCSTSKVAALMPKFTATQAKSQQIADNSSEAKVANSDDPLITASNNTPSPYSNDTSNMIDSDDMPKLQFK